jgi:hypothetical protein
MKTVAMILELAAPLQAGFHIRIENEPWMALVIEWLTTENRTAI